MSVFGNRMKYLRESMGATQEDIARLLGISRAAVSKYESGYREPDIKTIRVLAGYFGVTVDCLFGLTEAIDSPEQVIEDAVVYSSQSHEKSRKKATDSGVPDWDEVESFMSERDFVRLARKIKENNLDVGLIENIVNNIILLKNQKDSR